LELGIEDLYQCVPYPFNQLESQCWDYFTNKNNLGDIVGEWALMSAKKKVRNEFGHPGHDFNLKHLN
jgi:hypothetical protein